MVFINFDNSVPCKTEDHCVLLTTESTCGGRPLYQYEDSMFYQGIPFQSESDCLCYFYAKSDSERYECISYSKLCLYEVFFSLHPAGFDCLFYV